MCTSSRVWVAMILPMGTLCYSTLKVRHWWHFLTCSFACTAIQGQKKWLCIRLSILLKPKWPIPSWHPLKTVSHCMASNTNWNSASCDSFSRSFLYRMPCLSLRWFHSQRSCWSLGGSVNLYGHWPRVPSCILAITLPRKGSASWACCQSLVVMQVTCGLSPTRSRMCRLQLYTSIGLMGALNGGFLQAFITTAVTQWCVPDTSGTHPGQDTFDKASASMLAFHTL